MLSINEWLPNPVGKDTGEFVELYNSEPAGLPLDGYAVGTGAKKVFRLDGGRIAANGYLLLEKSSTKLSLKNTDGEVLLYGPGGRVIESETFAGAAPEGRSWARVDHSALPVGHFAFTYSTPGTANPVIDTSVARNDYPMGVPLTPRIGLWSVAVLALATAVFTASVFIYVIRKNRNISDLFFPRDEGARR